MGSWAPGTAQPQLPGEEQIARRRQKDFHRHQAATAEGPGDPGPPDAPPAPTPPAPTRRPDGRRRGIAEKATSVFQGFWTGGLGGVLSTLSTSTSAPATDSSSA